MKDLAKYRLDRTNIRYTLCLNDDLTAPEGCSGPSLKEFAEAIKNTPDFDKLLRTRCRHVFLAAQRDDDWHLRINNTQSYLFRDGDLCERWFILLREGENCASKPTWKCCRGAATIRTVTERPSAPSRSAEDVSQGSIGGSRGAPGITAPPDPSGRHGGINEGPSRESHDNRSQEAVDTCMVIPAPGGGTPDRDPCPRSPSVISISSGEMPPVPVTLSKAISELEDPKRRLTDDTMYHVIQALKREEAGHTSKSQSLVLDPLWLELDGPYQPPKLPTAAGLGQRIFFPLHHRQIEHWTLAVMVVQSTKIHVDHYDSCTSPERSEHTCKRMSEWVKGMGMKEAPVFESKVSICLSGKRHSLTDTGSCVPSKAMASAVASSSWPFFGSTYKISQSLLPWTPTYSVMALQAY